MHDTENSLESSMALCKKWAEAAAICYRVSIKVSPGTFHETRQRAVTYQLTEEEKERLCHILRHHVTPQVARMPEGLCIDYAWFSYICLYGADGEKLITLSGDDINGDGPDGLWNSPAKVYGKEAKFLNEIQRKARELFNRENNIK